MCRANPSIATYRYWRDRTWDCPRGTFAFETRNPLARAWERWNPDTPTTLSITTGAKLRMIYRAETEIADLVTFIETATTLNGLPLRVDRASLRFLSARALDAHLAGAGFTIIERYGDFTGGPFTATSETIVTVARRV
jgi:hypothetical protein